MHTPPKSATGAIIFTLQEFGCLEKGCFRFYVFRPALFVNLLYWNGEKLKSGGIRRGLITLK